MESEALRTDPLTAATTFPAALPRLAAKRGAAASLARSILLRKLASLREGSLTIVDGRERFTFGRESDAFPVRATIDVRDRSFWPRATFGGSIGAGEAFMDEAWTCDDLVALARILVRNRESLDGLDSGAGKLAAPLHALYHRLRDNTLAGSRKNIEAHYDLGNEFYALFLDPTMTYSAAVWERGDETLEEAQLAKIDRLCRKLDLKPGEHLLEIGTGWGAFAIRAAQAFGVRVTTTTISREQHRFATERVRAAGLEDRVRVLCEDYRDLQGSYDKLVSVEMIEAVGWKWFDTFFATVSRLLKPDGLAALQAITIDDRYYESARRSVDFIQRYVFPGSTIPSVGALGASVRRASDLRLVHHEEFGAHYARTLAEWSRALEARIGDVRALGFSDRFVRLWRFYFAYCEGGFAERQIQSVQLVFAKPRDRSRPILGAL